MKTKCKNKVAEVKLSYKRKLNQAQDVKIGDSHKAYEVLMDNWDHGQLEHRESFKIILMNRANTVLGIYTVSEGGVSETVVDVMLVLQAIILSNANSLILAHNHPSGATKPSWQDDSITRRIKDAVKLLNVNVEDHLIITPKSYYSYADEGQL